MHRVNLPRFAIASWRQALGSRALLVGLVAGGIVTPLTAHASSGTPDSCGAFVKKYFGSGAPDRGTANFTLASHNTHIGTSIGPIGAVPVQWGNGGSSVVELTNAPNRWSPSTLVGHSQEYFSDRTYSPPSDGPFPLLDREPFNPDGTDRLGVTIAQGGLLPGLSVVLTLESWDNARVTVTPQGCIGDNLVYGTTGDAIVSIALDDLEAPTILR